MYNQFMADFILDLKKLAGGNYDEFWGLKKGYSAMKTGKSAKKSTEIGKYIAVNLLLDPYKSAIVLRKVGVDHQTSTIPAVVKGFNYISLQTGYNWKKYWEIKPGAMKPVIENKLTGQKIYFVSFDRPDSLSGLDLSDPRLYYGLAWFEEPLQVSDKIKKIETNSLTEEQNFSIIESTLFRGTLPHPKSFREMILSFNDWSDGDNWIINKFIKPFITENETRLEKVGKQVTYDPTAFENKGIMVMVGSGALNEFHDEDYKTFIKNIKKTDPEFYKAIWLGTNASFQGNAFTTPNLNRIKRDIPQDLSDLSLVMLGGDFSSTKDKTVIVLAGFKKSKGDLFAIDGYCIPKNSGLTDPQKVRKILAKMKEWETRYNMKVVSHLNPNLKIRTRFDSRDRMVYETLNEQMDQDKFIKLTYNKFRPAAKFHKAGKYVRYLSLRLLMAEGKLHIAPHLKDLFNELVQTQFKKDGEIEDGNDDWRQAFEYSFSWNLRFVHGEKRYNAILQMAAAKQTEKDLAEIINE